MRTETTTRTLYTFGELNDTAKAYAICKWREDSDNNADTFWAECPTDDFRECLKACGFEVETYRGTRRPAITWSGFSSQGDGAAFAASWCAAECKPDAWLADRPVTYERDGKTVTCAHNQRWHNAVADIVAVAAAYPRGNGSVSLGRGNNMCLNQFTDDCDADRDTDEGGDMFKDACESLANAFYRTLESEYEYQNSDAVIAETLEANGYEFGRDGEMA